MKRSKSEKKVERAAKEYRRLHSRWEDVDIESMSDVEYGLIEQHMKRVALGYMSLGLLLFFLGIWAVLTLGQHL